MMKSPYRHTQTSLLIAAILVFFLFVAIAVIITTHYAWEAVILYILLAVVLASFMTLNIEIRAGNLELRYGFGFVRRTIPLSEIRNLCVVEMPAMRGYSTRMTSSGQLYNLNGNQVVEIDLQDGRVIRVGSDEPVELARAIENELIAMRKK